MIFITTNKSKISEAQEILGLPIQGWDFKMQEIQGTNCEKVVMHSLFGLKNVKLPFQINSFIVEDSGLELGKNEEIGALIKWLPNNRVVRAYLGEKATAVCAIGHSSGKIFKGEVKGKIVKPRGNNGFGWDEIFEVNGKTFAEMTPEEKNKVSPRRIALEKLKDSGILEK